MREIKFKAKRKDNNEWVYGYYLKTTKDNRYYIYNGEYSELVSIINGIETFEPARYNMQIIEVIPETICQYTGLKDKNGVEIYENDIILIGEKRRQVEVIFLNGQFGYLYEASCVSFQYQKPEVVGNIYDKEVK